MERKKTVQPPSEIEILTPIITNSDDDAQNDDDDEPKLKRMRTRLDENGYETYNSCESRSNSLGDFIIISSQNDPMCIKNIILKTYHIFTFAFIIMFFSLITSFHYFIYKYVKSIDDNIPSIYFQITQYIYVGFALFQNTFLTLLLYSIIFHHQHTPKISKCKIFTVSFFINLLFGLIALILVLETTDYYIYINSNICNVYFNCANHWSLSGIWSGCTLDDQCI